VETEFSGTASIRDFATSLLGTPLFYADFFVNGGFSFLQRTIAQNAVPPFP